MTEHVDVAAVRGRWSLEDLDEGSSSRLRSAPAGAKTSPRAIGIVPQEGGVDGLLTVREVVELYGAANPRPARSTRSSRLVGSGGKRDARVETLFRRASGAGSTWRWRSPAIPAATPAPRRADHRLRPVGAPRAWELIEGLRSLDKTIVLTTHYMDEAQQLADRVAVIAGGRIVAEGPPGNPRRPRGRRRRRRLPASARDPAEELPLGAASS